MTSVLRGQANVFARRQPNIAFFTKRSFANRPVQTIYASPLRRAQNFIDRKLPTQWLVYGIVGANGLVYAAWSYAEDCARRYACRSKRSQLAHTLAQIPRFQALAIHVWQFCVLMAESHSTMDLNHKLLLA